MPKLFGNLDMTGGKVTDLAPGTAGTDAVNKNQLDAVSADVTEVENAVAGIARYAPLQVHSATPPEFVLTPDGEVIMVPVP